MWNTYKVHNIKSRYYDNLCILGLTKIKTDNLKNIGYVEGLAHKKYYLTVDDNNTITAT